MDEAWTRLDTIRNAVERAGKELVVYVSMGFGNPYGDAWSAERVADWSRRLHREMGVKHLALSDTVGQATAPAVSAVFQEVVGALPDCHIGAHLHGRPDQTAVLMQAAWEAGCRAFDGALGSMVVARWQDDLVGRRGDRCSCRHRRRGARPGDWNASRWRKRSSGGLRFSRALISRARASVEAVLEQLEAIAVTLQFNAFKTLIVMRMRKRFMGQGLARMRVPIRVTPAAQGVWRAGTTPAHQQWEFLPVEFMAMLSRRGWWQCEAGCRRASR